MKRLFLLLIVIAGTTSCGPAKTQFIDTKYDLCMKKCNLTYSRYESQELSKCRSKCSQARYNKD